MLGGWLYRSAQFVASDVVRAERRRAREQEAQAMQEISRPTALEADWQKLGPVLDQAIGELGDRDRDAVVLRFFEGRPLAEIGATRVGMADRRAAGNGGYARPMGFGRIAVAGEKIAMGFFVRFSRSRVLSGKVTWTNRISVGAGTGAAWAVGLAALLAGCAHATKPEEGKSDFTFMTPPAAPRRPPRQDVPGPTLPAPPRDLVTAAEPLPPLAKPVYPKAVLGKRAGTVMIGVRLTVDPQGQVKEIEPSPLSISTPTEFAPEFRTAVEAAVRQWRFKPATVRRAPRPGEPTPGFDQPAKPAEPTEWVFDVSFTFGASGDVLSGVPQ